MKNIITILLVLLTVIVTGQSTVTSAETDPRMLAVFTTTVDRCPSGWREVEYAQGRMVMGTTDINRVKHQQGKPVQYGHAPLHSHKINTTLQPKALAAGGNKNNYVFMKTNAAADNQLAFDGPIRVTGHTTEMGKTLVSYGNVPYRKMLICEEREEKKSRIADRLPGQVVAFFNGKSCPPSWQPFKPLDGRYVLPNPLNARADQVGKEIGQALPLVKGGRRKTEHVHDITVGSGLDDGIAVPVELNAKSRKYHTNWSSVAIDKIPKQIVKTAGSGPEVPIVEMLACYKKDGKQESAKHFPQGLSIFFLGGKNCPSQWDEYTPSRGYYLIGLPMAPDNSERVNGFNVGSQLKDMSLISHLHSVTMNLDIPVHNYYSGFWKAFPRTETYGGSGKYEFKGTSLPEPAALPYVSVTHCHIPERRSRGSGERAR